MNLVYYNGKLGNFRGMSVPLSDRAIFFGDGVYDAVLGRGAVPYLLDKHIERLLQNADKLKIPFKMSGDELCELIFSLIKESGLSDFFLYLQITANADERRHAPRDEDKSNLLISIKDFTPIKKDLKLISFPDVRQRFCYIKSLNLLGSVMASEAAHSALSDEAVFIRDGYVTECSHSNIFIVKDSVLFTHPTDEKILPGIMRSELLKTARSLGIECRETAFSLSELLDADDVLITSTSKLTLRATSLDGCKIGGKNSEIGDELMAHMFKDFQNLCEN